MLQKLTDHRREKIKQSARALGTPANDVEVTSHNRGVVRSWLNGLGLPSHLYDCATLEELQEAYKSCNTGYGGIRRLLEKQIEDEDELQVWTHEAAKRAYENMPYSGDMHDPDVVCAVTGTTQTITLTSDPSEPHFLSVPQQPQPITQGNAPMSAQPQPIAPSKPNNEEQAALHLVQALEALQALGGGGNQPTMDEKRIIELIKEHSISTKIELTIDKTTRTVEGLHHELMPHVLKAVQCGCNVMLVGPAGSGKTFMASQIAKALEIPFYFNGALSSEYKLTGFMDANGKLVRTPFREAYEKGGVYLFDEIDGSMPDALLAFNAALSNGCADFPDGTVEKHEDFHCIAAANTYGKGADRVYVGRSQLDGASLDRFVIIDLDYDEKLEKALSGNEDWTRFVQRVRAAVSSQKVRHIVSPRASIEGAKLLEAGIRQKIVEDMTVWKGLDKDTKRKIENAMAAA